MKKIIVALIVLILPIIINGKELKTEWIKSWGTSESDICNSGIATKSNEIIISAYKFKTIIIDGKNTGVRTPYILKYDLDGNLIKTIEFDENTNGILNITEMNDGGYLLYGSLSVDIDGTQSNGESDLVIAKYDKNDNMIWKKRYGGDKDEKNIHLQITDDNEFIISLTTTSTYFEEIKNNGEEDAVIMKLDSSGNILWKSSIAGSLYDAVLKMKILEDDSFIAIGYYYSTDIPDMSNKGEYDSFIIKYDKYGNVIWKQTFGGIKADGFNDVLVTKNNEYIVTGMSSSTDIDGIEENKKQEGIILKYDVNGNLLWKKVYGTKEFDSLEKIIELENNEYIIKGSIKQINVPVFFRVVYKKIDENGKIIWEKFVGNTGLTTSANIIKYVNDSIIAVGKTTSTDIENLENKGGNDALFLHYDKDGNIVNQFLYGGSKEDLFQEVIKTKDNELIVVGDSNSTDIERLENKGNEDILIMKLSYDYNLQTKEMENGSATVIQDKSKGVITPKAEKGYQVDKIIIKDTEGNEIEAKLEKDGTYSFDLYDDVTVEVLFAQAIENPKTGVLDALMILFIGLIISLAGFIVIKKYNERLEI